MENVYPAAHTCVKSTTSRYLRVITQALLLTLFALITFSAVSQKEAHAGQVAISWDADTSQGVSGYKIHYGTASGNYSQSVDVGNVTSYTVSGLTEAQTYYFAAVAYNSSGQQSAYSNEISKTIVSTVPSTYTITATASTNGTITAVNNSNTSTSSSGSSIITSVTVSSGAAQSFSITPNAGYKVASVTVDGASVGAVSTYTFSNVTANHTITATFTSTTSSTFTVSASVGNGGSISPAGTVSVNSGASQSFTVSPNTGYYTTSVTVDGSVVATNQGFYTYTFSNVTANHSISAAFAIATYTITPTAGTGGSISPTSARVNYGGSQTFTVTPSSGYKISDVKVDGASVGAVSTYTFNNVSANHTISATFVSSASSSYTITASAGTGGSISPSGAASVTGGTSKSFTITPNKGYYVAGVTVDGSVVASNQGSYTYTFSNVTANHTISATFSVATYTIMTIAGTGGSISPTSAVVNYGGSQTFTITPAKRRTVASVLVDGQSVGAVKSYTFTNVTAAHTIQAVFK